MTMVRKIIVIGVLIILACVMFIPAFGADSGNIVTALEGPEDRGSYLEPSYSDYLAEHGFSGVMAASEIKVDLQSYRTSEDMQAYIQDGAVVTGESGTITWDVMVREAGFYQIQITYVPVRGTTSKIERKLYIDDTSYFKGMNQLIFHRKWDNSGGQQVAMMNGNEVRPVAVELPEPMTVYIMDAQRRNLEPYRFYLSAGRHTLTLESVKEPMEIRDITLKSAPEIKPYAEVIEEWKALYPVYDGDNLVYQAERIDDLTLSIMKSSIDIVMNTDYSNPYTVPYHPYKIRLNTIGGTNWRTPGDYIEWKIHVPQEGLYRISFRAVQNTNRGVMSFRQLKVNGEVPFREAMAIPFAFHSDFANYVFGSEEGEYLIHLREGENMISLEVVLGSFAMPLSEVEQSVLVLSDLYRKTIQITGLVPDRFIDYELTKKIPNYAETLKAESDRLKMVVEELVAITGEKGEKTAIIEKMQVQAERLSQDPESVILEVGTFANNISSLGTWITSISEMPLMLDSFTLSAPGAELPAAEPNFFVNTYNSTVRFLSTFLIDETEITGDAGDDAIKVWISAGRDQAQLIKTMIDQTFTPQTNIPVNLQLIPEDVILPATLAGNGPDVVLALPQATVINFAMRNALHDLSKLDGFDEIVKGFNPNIMNTVTFQDGVYGLPEQQIFLMMFYREDVFEQLGLTPPKTWDEVEHIISVLHANNYDFYINGQELYPSLVYQYGGDLYLGEGLDYGIRSGLGEEAAMNAFSRVTRFFTSYRLPVSADFSNRFRTGEMPAGITLYTTYNQLEVFAPEIRGLWSFAPLPGVEQPDGTINHGGTASTINTVMLETAKNKEAAWEFIKWWQRADTQIQYANALESIMGAAARYPAANIEVMKQLPWSTKAARELMTQLESVVGYPEVPGGYMTARAIDYAFRGVVTNGEHPREALYLHLKSVDEELTKKRKEFNLSYIGGN